MSRDVTREEAHEGESSSGASDFEDSFLRELRESEPLHGLPLPGARLGGPDGRRYLILAWMGGGGMGQVFRARDETLQREVALKFLLPRPGFEAEALAEARAVARLDHENIVRIFDVSEWRGSPDEPGLPFLVMECLEGESLATLLKRGRLEPRRALEVLDGIAAGLAHAHERGIVHRDLKPGNVFLTPPGTVKLLVAPDAPRAWPLPERHPDGRYSLTGAAKQFGVTPTVVRGWIRRGLVPARREDFESRRAVYWLEIDEDTARRLQTLVASRRAASKRTRAGRPSGVHAS